MLNYIHQEMADLACLLVKKKVLILHINNVLAFFTDLLLFDFRKKNLTTPESLCFHVL